MRVVVQFLFLFLGLWFEYICTTTHLPDRQMSIGVYGIAALLRTVDEEERPGYVFVDASEVV